MQRGAQFDPTGRYRYTLWRQWDPNGDRIAFVMLNPSTADAECDDPTIRRCLGFAQRWGYGYLEVVNLFAYRTPHPQDLQHVTDPVGTETDRYLLEAIHRADRVILAWGNKGAWGDRARQVFQILSDCSPIYCLGLTRRNEPRHPLYTRADTSPLLFQAATEHSHGNSTNPEI